MESRVDEQNPPHVILKMVGAPAICLQGHGRLVRRNQDSCERFSKIVVPRPRAQGDKAERDSGRVKLQIETYESSAPSNHRWAVSSCCSYGLLHPERSPEPQIG